jgi:glutamine synthetase type III
MMQFFFKRVHQHSKKILFEGDGYSEAWVKLKKEG